MRNVHLDFLHPRPRVPWAAWALLGGGILLAGMALWRQDGLARDLAREEGVALKLRAESQPPVARFKDARVSQSASRATLQAQLQIPWVRLFRSLEKNRPKNIALLSLEADDRRSEASLTAEAPSAEAMLAYLEALKNEAGLKGVVLSSHEVQEGDEQRPLRFVIGLGWRE